jgi:hypothetical protein
METKLGAEVNFAPYLYLKKSIQYSLWLIILNVKSLFTDNDSLLAEIAATFYPSDSISNVDF